jgi:hypothetical protein
VAAWNLASGVRPHWNKRAAADSKSRLRTFWRLLRVRKALWDVIKQAHHTHTDACRRVQAGEGERGAPGCPQEWGGGRLIQAPLRATALLFHVICNQIYVLGPVLEEEESCAGE